MTSRDFDPFRLDVAAFAKHSGQLEGAWPLTPFDRLTEAAAADEPACGPSEVSWSVRGEHRVLRGGDVQVWLHLNAATALPLECQRCLKPVDVPLRAERSFLFVHGEDAATQDDVLALTRALDLRELIEDELLLALPLVPRHEVCPVPLRIEHDEPESDDKPHPFAGLAALKRPGPLN